jgi:hypothetical protein
MISDVDAALEALIRREALNGSRVELAFDAPTKDWVARRNAPALDLYLYDIREDLPRREVAREDVRDEATGLVSGRRRPIRRFRLSYLLTAWTQRPEDEHRLLAACLSTFVRHEYIPVDLVGGVLADARYPVYLFVGQPPPQDRSIADVWSALGGELKPSLDLIAVAPLDPSVTEEVAGPVLEPPTLGVGPLGGGAGEGGRERIRQRRGRLAARLGAPLGPADEAEQVELVQAGGVGTRSRGPDVDAARDESGRKRPAKRDRTAGDRTAGGGAGAGGAAAGGAAADAEGGSRAAPDLGTFGQGRVVRIRGIRRP